MLLLSAAVLFVLRLRTKDKTDSRQTERELEKNKRPSPLKDPSVIRSKERVYARITKPVFGFHRDYTRWNRLDELIMNMAGNKFYLRPKGKSKTLLPNMFSDQIRLEFQLWETTVPITKQMWRFDPLNA